mmetsp:Transcript_33989/g.61603  ORF Transcript_33989/g.61603 Transcript_33989/m.61603 type:complete len:115 (+) Transcript_33989:114-458(+)
MTHGHGGGGGGFGGVLRSCFLALISLSRHHKGSWQPQHGYDSGQTQSMAPYIYRDTYPGRRGLSAASEQSLEAWEQTLQRPQEREDGARMMKKQAQKREWNPKDAEGHFAGCWC